MNDILNIASLSYHLVIPRIHGSKTLEQLAQIEATCRIAARVVEGIEGLEMRVLDSIDKLVMDHSHRSSSDTLVLGTCIRRMALHYRKIVKWGYYPQGMFIHISRDAVSPVNGIRTRRAEGERAEDVRCHDTSLCPGVQGQGFAIPQRVDQYRTSGCVRW